MSIFDIFGGGKKSSSEPAKNYEPIPYTPSKFDSQDAQQLNDFYSSRAAGQNTGYGEDDLRLLNSDAQDHATRNMNEAIRRGAAGRRVGTGGTYSGGRDVLRDNAIQSGLEFKSNAMRDIAVRNAVQKHTDQWQANAGLGNFLNSERAHAMSQWTGQNQQNQMAYTYNELYPSLTGQANNQYSAQQVGAGAADIAKILAGVYSSYKANQGPTASPSPTGWKAN